jgi:hypothetical protein
MEKSTWVKIVWLGAIVAIPAAIIAVQKPAAPRAAETHRVIAFDQPVSVDISDRYIEGAPAVEPVASASAEAVKPRAVRLGAEKITLKEGAAATQEPAVARAEGTKAEPAKAEGAPAVPRMDSLPSVKEQTLTSILAPVAGPKASPSP